MKYTEVCFKYIREDGRARITTHSLSPPTNADVYERRRRRSFATETTKAAAAVASVREEFKREEESDGGYSGGYSGGGPSTFDVCPDDRGRRRRREPFYPQAHVKRRMHSPPPVGPLRRETAHEAAFAGSNSWSTSTKSEEGVR